MDQPDYDRGRVGAYLGLGAGFAGSTLVFAALGWYLDRLIGTSPIFTLLGTFVGAAAGFYSLYRRAMALQDEAGAEKRENDRNSEPYRNASDSQWNGGSSTQ